MTPRLIAYGIAAAVLIGLLSWGVITYNESLREQGRAEIRADDAEALRVAKEKADAESKRLKKLAEDARNANAQELAELRAYRADNPLHGGLCKPAKNNRSAVSSPAATVTVNAGASTGTADVQPVPAGDTEPGGQSDTDIRGMLDALAARADQVSGQLREWQAR